MDKSTDIIKAIARLSYFYKHESCGQCTPCREGTGWMWRVMERMVKGESSQARDRHALRCHQAGRRPHHLCAWRCGCMADPGLIKNFRPVIEQRIDDYVAKSRTSSTMVAAE
jgi:NADH-quinone oxidoreductase subunit F